MKVDSEINFHSYLKLCGGLAHNFRQSISFFLLLLLLFFLFFIFYWGEGAGCNCFCPFFFYAQ